MAQGQAEITAVKKVYIKVAHWTDVPRISMNRPTNGSFVYSASSLGGTLKDDDGVGGFLIEYQNPATKIWQTIFDTKTYVPDPADPDAYVFIPGQMEHAINIPLTDDLPGIKEEGEKHLRITVYDDWDHDCKIGADKDQKRVVTREPWYLTFTKDTIAPSFKVIDPKEQPSAPKYLFTDTFKMSGTLEELNLDKLITVDGKPMQINWTMTIDDEGKDLLEGYLTVSLVSGSTSIYNWTLQDNDKDQPEKYVDIINGSSVEKNNRLDFSKVTDGSRTLRLSAKDKAGNTGYAQIVFTKDNTPPDVIFTESPTTNTGMIVEKYAKLSGQFADQLSQIGYKNKDAAGNVTEISDYYFMYRIYRDNYTTPETTPPAWKKFILGAQLSQSKTWEIPLTKDKSATVSNGDVYTEISSAFWDGLDEIPDGRWYLELYVADRLNNGVIYGDKDSLETALGYAANIDETPIKDEHDVVVSATGHKHNKISFYVNRMSPKVRFTSEENSATKIQPIYGGKDLAAETNTSKPLFTLTGTVDDGDVDELKIVLKNSAGVEQTVTGYSLSGPVAGSIQRTLTWTFTVGDFRALPADDSYTITWSVTDGEPKEPTTTSLTPAVTKLGTLNTTTKALVKVSGVDTEVSSITFVRDTTPPRIEYTSISETKINWTYWNTYKDSTAPNNLDYVSAMLGDAPVLQGNFIDAHSKIGFKQNGNNKYYYEYRIYPKKIMEQATSEADLDSTLETKYPYRQREFNKTDTLTTEQWTIPLTSLNIDGNDNGYDNHFWADKEVDWKIAGKSAKVIPEGMYWLDLKVADRIDNRVIDNDDLLSPKREGNHYIMFSVDRTPPVLTIDKINGQTIENNANLSNTFNEAAVDAGWLKLEGTITELNFRRLKVKVGNIAEKTYTIANDKTEMNITHDVTKDFPDPDGYITKTHYNWEWTMPLEDFQLLKNSNPAPYDGRYTITVTAEDYGVRPDIKEHTFIKDTSPPETKTDIDGSTLAYVSGKIDFTKIKSIRNQDASIGGSFLDTWSDIGEFGKQVSGQYYFKYRIGNADQTNPAWETYLLGADPGKSPNWSIPLTENATVSTGNSLPKQFWYNQKDIPDGLWWLEKT